MLAAVKLAEQWREIEAGLAPDWAEAQVVLEVAEGERADQAALMLGPLSPGRTGRRFRLTVRRGADPARVLRRLDAEGIRGRLDLVSTEQSVQPAAARPERTRPLTEQWDALIGRLP